MGDNDASIFRVGGGVGGGFDIDFDQIDFDGGGHEVEEEEGRRNSRREPEDDVYDAEVELQRNNAISNWKADHTKSSEVEFTKKLDLAASESFYEEVDENLDSIIIRFLKRRNELRKTRDENIVTRKDAEALREKEITRRDEERRRVVVTDGQAHAVDSNDISFQLAMLYGIRQGVKAAKPQILEPMMSLEVAAPSEFQGAIIGGLNKRSGMIMNTDLNEDGSGICIKADVPLAEMFGYSTDIRSSTQGKGEFSMEYKQHQPVAKTTQEELIKAYVTRMASKGDDEDE